MTPMDPKALTTEGLHESLLSAATNVMLKGTSIVEVLTPIAALEAIYWCMARRVPFTMGASPDVASVYAVLDRTGRPQICLLYPKMPEPWFRALSVLKVGHGLQGQA